LCYRNRETPLVGRMGADRSPAKHQTHLAASWPRLSYRVGLKSDAGTIVDIKGL